MARLPKALESAMEDQMSVKGGAQIQSPETIYDSDSLCIIHFQAVAKDPTGKDYSFPVWRKTAGRTPPSSAPTVSATIS